MMDGLKPCPFCGGEAVLAWDHMDRLEIRVDHARGCVIGGMKVIPYCYSKVGHLESMERDAAAMWNRRTA